jgi:hypothetical protein|eukprot:evm.model.NODE_31053_length_64317_cov_55.547771.6
MHCFVDFVEQTIYTDPLIQIVILAAPTYIIVAEAIYFPPMVHVHCHDAPKRVLVWYSPIEVLQLGTELRGKITLIVWDPIQLGDKVDIMEYDALTLWLCQANLCYADITKPTTVEELIVCLLDDPEGE